MVSLEGGVAATLSSAFRPAAYSLMRGVSVKHLLAAAGAVFRVRVDELPASDQARLFARSAPARAYHRFLSHCWSSPGWHKFYALASDHLGLPAFVAASVAAVAVHIVQICYALPAVACNDLYNGNWYGLSFWELCLGEAAAVCVAFAGHNFCTTQYFLDCVCIDQTNRELKQAGVAHIPEFVRSSRELFVLWDEAYLTRLWCVYELAVAHAGSDRTTIRIMPLGVSVTLVMLHVLLFVSQLVPRLLYVFVPLKVQQGGASQLVRQALFLFMKAFCLAFVARAGADMARMLQSLEDEFSFFRVRSTRIFDEEDRRILYESIVEMYGSLDAFDNEVRTRVRKTVMDCFAGQRALLPYRALMVPLIAEIPNVMSSCSGEIGQPVEVRAVIFISCMAESFALQPALIAMAMSLGGAAGRSGRMGNWALFVAIGVVLAMVRRLATTLLTSIPKAIAHGSSPLGLELEPWHAVPCTLVAALPMCLASVWFFRPAPATPSGAAAPRFPQGAVELLAVPETRSS